MRNLILFTNILAFILLINVQSVLGFVSPKDSSIQVSIAQQEDFLRSEETTRFKRVNLSTKNLAKNFFKTHNVPQDEDFLFADDKIKVSQVYPNPASVSATIDYNLMDSNINAQITVTNLLGREIARYNLLRDNHKIRIPTIKYDAGIYFYRLYINGKAVKAKKLVVKHN